MPHLAKWWNSKAQTPFPPEMSLNFHLWYVVFSTSGIQSLTSLHSISHYIKFWRVFESRRRTQISSQKSVRNRWYYAASVFVGCDIIIQITRSSQDWRCFWPATRSGDRLIPQIANFARPRNIKNSQCLTFTRFDCTEAVFLLNNNYKLGRMVGVYQYVTIGSEFHWQNQRSISFFRYDKNIGSLNRSIGRMSRSHES